MTYHANHLTCHNSCWENKIFNSKVIKEWFNFNRERMNDIDINDIHSTNGIGLHKEKHGEEINNFFNKLQTNSIQEKDI